LRGGRSIVLALSDRGGRRLAVSSAKEKVVRLQRLWTAHSDVSIAFLYGAADRVGDDGMRMCRQPVLVRAEEHFRASLGHLTPEST
jgi:hypothetical protein